MHHISENTRTNRRAFTLIELLVVIVVIAILAGIFFGVAKGVNERGRISRATTELSLLAQYLEQYKATYGDYPHVTNGESNSAGSATKREGEDGIVALYNALNGLRAIDGEKLDPRQRAFVDRSKFFHEFSPSLEPPTPTDPEEEPVALIDPWGNAYRYYYEPTLTAWENPIYLLYSMGPSGTQTEPQADGYLEKENQQNLDNIYAN